MFRVNYTLVGDLIPHRRKAELDISDIETPIGVEVSTNCGYNWDGELYSPPTAEMLRGFFLRLVAQEEADCRKQAAAHRERAKKYLEGENVSPPKNSPYLSGEVDKLLRAEEERRLAFARVEKDAALRRRREIVAEYAAATKHRLLLEQLKQGYDWPCFVDVRLQEDFPGARLCREMPDKIINPDMEMLGMAAKIATRLIELGVFPSETDAFLSMFIAQAQACGPFSVYIEGWKPHPDPVFHGYDILIPIKL